MISNHDLPEIFNINVIAIRVLHGESGDVRSKPMFINPAKPLQMIFTTRRYPNIPNFTLDWDSLDQPL